MTEAVKPFPGVAEFFFGTPLYTKISTDEITKILRDEITVDGHCPYCHRTSTFTRKFGEWQNSTWLTFFDEHRSKPVFGTPLLVCARNSDHILRFYLMVEGDTLEKIGQTPSFADIANDESKHYSGVLSKEDASELHKAIGLAAHGVGIGSFVYLRRIFERLIWKRFNELKNSEEWKDLEAEGWTEEKFRKRRMDEKVEFLTGHLPDFLVDNSKIYSILSLGIHQLNEVTCLQYFEVRRKSIQIILAEDKRKEEERNDRAELAKVISNFTVHEFPEGEEKE